MTQELLQIMVLGILAVIFSVVLKKHSHELSILLTLAAGVLIALFFLRLFQPVLSFAEELREMTGLDQELMEPVLKCLGISLLCQICVNICTDAGQTAIGKMIETSGCILCLYVALPLFRSVISLVSSTGA